ncbi:MULTISPECIES: LysR family transcriptional regulator [Providencia]|uniref:LysR family transcriptional regulator n=1 Tax=Providencia TaxID=586 RepID=UPI001C5BB352|nr:MULTISPECIES: LysR family transcriptional regulator [Providencia]QXX81467.1 LysR family transcriptional regulator [Providencia sp. R33]
MDTRLLRAFITLAETKNYKEASTRLYISQPALTKQIKLLEEQLNLRLFERGRHGAMLTEHGIALLPYAKQVLSHVQELLNQALVLKEEPPKVLHVGFGISSFQEASLFVAHLREKLPSVAIVLDDMPSHTMRDNLLSHQLDIAFTRHVPQAPTENIIKQFLKTEVLALAISREYTQHNSIRDYLTQYPLLMLRAERGLGLYQQIQRYLQSEDLHIAPLQEASDIQTLIALVAAKVGVSLVPYSAKYIAQEDVHFIPLHHCEAAKWQIDVVWHTSLPKTWQSIFHTLIDNIHETP